MFFRCKSWDSFERGIKKAVFLTDNVSNIYVAGLGANSMHQSDITVAEDFVMLLRPVKSATIIICEEDHPGVSVIAPFEAKLLEHFGVSEENSILVTEMKQG